MKKAPPEERRIRIKKKKRRDGAESATTRIKYKMGPQIIVTLSPVPLWTIGTSIVILLLVSSSIVGSSVITDKEEEEHNNVSQPKNIRGLNINQGELFIGKPRYYVILTNAQKCLV